MRRSAQVGAFVLATVLATDCAATIAVDAAANRLDVYGELLVPQVVGKILQELRSRPEVDTVRFINVPGGIVGADQMLRNVIGKYAVEVKGVCFSSCAMVALSARELRLLKEDNPRAPTALLVHGTYDFKKRSWSPYGLSYVPFLRQRLRAITEPDLREAMSYDTAQPNGLAILREPSGLMPDKSIVFLCPAFPTTCQSRPGITHSMLGISLKP